MLNSYSIANPLTTIRVPRLLSRPGEVLVRSGDAVEPTHIVAQATPPPDFRIVEIAQALDVPIKNALSCLKVERGTSVREGDVLAARGGLSSRVCRSPLDGRVVGIGRGRLLLEAEPRLVRLNALVPGHVVEVRDGQGVVIETVGGFIQARWGNGSESYGILRMVVRESGYPLLATQINASAQGTILVGGATLDAECVKQAQEMQVRGVVVGSVPTSLIPCLRQAPFPILATQGVGDTPMARAVFELLRSMDGRAAAVSADCGTRWRIKRPFLAVPMPTRVAQAVDLDAPLTVGARVRILRGNARGQSGRVARELRELVQLETGARLPGVEVALGDDELVQVPYVNLERLL